VSERGRHRAYLVLGSNREPEIYLPRAVRELTAHGEVVAVSRVYETVPVGTADPAPFLNAAVVLETGCGPERFKRDVIAGIEARLGRVRDPRDRFAPRTIDIDIALWDDLVGEVLGRPVPDPDILRHLHVARPLADVEPDLHHPVDGRTLAEIAASLEAGAALPHPRPDVVFPADPR
jgi:2-amino-4-hydroxy-6-hydroxymethyldihydropteridine diphosphokinase